MVNFFKKIKNKKLQPNNEDGTLLIIVVVMTGLFVFMLSGYLTMITFQQRLTHAKIAKIQALHIAEAGINYYRWHLAHEPEDYQDGTGVAGPYIHDYEDPTTGLIGTFSLEVTPPEIGSTVVTIKSVGWINDYPEIKRTLEVKYGEETLAKYSFLTHNDIWLGSSESVSGEMHSNGGIRMDGSNDSLVTSALSTYTCTPSHGCSNETRDGVWGSGANSDLWSFPTSAVDFDTITINLATIKIEAESNGDYYAGQNYGYHITFLADGTYNIYTITSLASGLSQINDDFNGCETKSEAIATEVLVGNYPVPTNSTIFIEDDLWIDGTLNGKITVVAARFPVLPSTYANIYINNNIQYISRDGTNALGLVAQKNIQVPRHAPDDLIIDAILLAQQGRVYRGYYCWWWQRNITNSIEVYGGIITNKVWTWSWVDGGGSTVDGYNTTNSIFNNNLLFAPPPHFPTSGEYQFISWEELPN